METSSTPVPAPSRCDSIQPHSIALQSRCDVLRHLCGLLAHDLNNQLGVISNHVHVLQRSLAAPTTQTSIEATLNGVKTASVLTAHLQRLSQRSQPREQALALAAFFDDVRPLLEAVVGLRSDLRVSVEPSTADVVVDADAFELALINLALNARQAFKATGQVRLRSRNAQAGEAPPALSGEAPPALSGGCVVITFGDDGIGLDGPAAKCAFEPGFTTRDPAEASGLGLTQVRAFCEAAGGRATLASTPGLGTTVFLWLPAAPR